MEQTNLNEASKSDNNTFQDFDLDNFNFEAIDKGLGFHHKETKLQKETSSASFRLQNNNLNTTKKINEVPVPTLKTDNAFGVSEISLDEAYAFSEKTQKDNLKDNGSRVDDGDLFESPMIESSLEKVSAAWAVDLTLILISIVSALILFGSATGISFNEFHEFFTRKESQIFIGVFFTIFYLLYFSVLDLNSSPGKLLFGTRLVATANQRLTVFNTFTRAFIILVSITLFMLPLIFGLHNKLSGTVSVEEKW